MSSASENGIASWSCAKNKQLLRLQRHHRHHYLPKQTGTNFGLAPSIIRWLVTCWQPHWLNCDLVRSMTCRWHIFARLSILKFCSGFIEAFSCQSSEEKCSMLDRFHISTYLCLLGSMPRSGNSCSSQPATFRYSSGARMGFSSAWRLRDVSSLLSMYRFLSRGSWNNSTGIVVSPLFERSISWEFRLRN